jgi:hypothetical protein
MTNGVSTALEGLKRSTSKLAESAATIASGDLEPESIIDLKINENDVKLQSKNLKIMLDQDQELLDILA